MRVTILTEYYPPDLVSTAQFLGELAEDLVDAGWEVSVVTAKPSYLGRIPAPRKEESNGLRVDRVFPGWPSRRSRFGRIIRLVAIPGLIFWHLLRRREFSINLVLSNPPTLPVVAFLVRYLFGTPYVYVVHDIYPEIAERLGFLRCGSVVFRLWHFVHHRVLSHATRIVVLGRCMQNAIRQTYRIESPAPPMVILPNWADGTLIRPEPPGIEQRARSGWQFVVQYSGNIGMCHEIRTILDAAGLLRSLPDIVFEFVGSGGSREDTERAVKERALPNVRFREYQPRTELCRSLNRGSVGLVTLKIGLEGLALPSKLYGVMASGRPVIAVVHEDSEVARTVREADCGIVVRPGNAEDLAREILRLRDSARLVATLGRNARGFLERHFERKIVTSRYARLLADVWDGWGRVREMSRRPHAERPGGVG